MDRLIKILSHKRPAGSVTERYIVKEVLTDKYEHTLMDGNVIITVGTGSTTLFSCHTDTVHSTPGVQKLAYDENFGTIHLDKSVRPAGNVAPIGKGHQRSFGPGVNFDRDCLGADDGAGMYLLLEMIDANVPGTYIFHHSEECGGLGSSALSHNTAFLSQFKRAIAFDRKGTGDIINNQRGGKCCSTEFVDALAAQLKTHDFDYKAATGSFTDTANYIDTIPECTNISCGYYNEHSAHEWLDIEHLTKLGAALVKIDWEALPAVRDPKEKPPVYNGGYYGRMWDDEYVRATKKTSLTMLKLKNMSLHELEHACLWNNDEVAEVLFKWLHPVVKGGHHGNK